MLGNFCSYLYTEENMYIVSFQYVYYSYNTLYMNLCITT